MSPKQKLGISLGLGCLLILAGVLIIPRFIKIDSLKTEIEKQAGKFLKRQVSIGRVQLRFLPSFGLELAGVKIANSNSFEEKPLMEIKEVIFKISLLDLFRQQIYLKKILVVEPKIFILRNQNRELNISDLFKKSGEKSIPEITSDRTQKRKLQIGVIQVSKGIINFEDRSQATWLPSLSAKLDELNLLVNLEQKNYLVNPSRITIGKSVFEFSGEINPNKYQFKYSSPNLNLGELSQMIDPLKKFIDSRKISLSGTALLSGIIESASPLSIQTNLDLKDAFLRYPGVIQKPLGEKFSLQLNLLQNPAEYRIEKMNLGFGGGDINAQGMFSKKYDLNLALSGKDLSLQEFSQLIEPLSSYLLQGKMELRGNLSGKLNQAQLLNFIIEQIRLSGPDLDLALQGTINNLSRPKIKLELKGQKLYLTRLTKTNKQKLEPETGEPVAKAKKSLKGEKTSKKEESFLEKVELNGQITLGEIVYRNYQFQNFQSNFLMNKGIMSFPDASFNFFKGQISGPLQIDLSRKKPFYQGNLAFRGVDLKEALKNYRQVGETVTGTLEGNLEFAGKGRSWAELKPQLNGQGKIVLTNGSFKTFNLVGSLLGDWANSKQVKKLLKAQLGKTQWQNLKETKFSQVESLLEIKDGWVKMKNFIMSFPEGKVQAEGKWDLGLLVEGSGELLMDEPTTKQIVKELGLSSEFTKYLFPDGKNLWLPFKIKGNYPNLMVSLDSESYTRKVSAGLKEQFNKTKANDLKQLLEQFMP